MHFRIEQNKLEQKELFYVYILKNINTRLKGIQKDTCLLSFFNLFVHLKSFYFIKAICFSMLQLDHSRRVHKISDYNTATYIYTEARSLA